MPCSASNWMMCLTGPNSLMASSVAGSSGCEAPSQTEPSWSLMAVCERARAGQRGLPRGEGGGAQRGRRCRGGTHAATTEGDDAAARKGQREDGGVAVELADLCSEGVWDENEVSDDGRPMRMERASEERGRTTSSLLGGAGALTVVWVLIVLVGAGCEAGRVRWNRGEGAAADASEPRLTNALAALLALVLLSR